MDTEQIIQAATTTGIAVRSQDHRQLRRWTGHRENYGVVAYESAHLDGVASEKAVGSGDSIQSHAETINEMRRILREHIGVG